MDKQIARNGVNKTSYDLSGLANGMYLLNINSEKGSMNYKLIVK
jgi:hypothetical protein